MGISGLIDIKGPVSFQGLPPFVLTALVLVAGALIACFLHRRQARSVCVEPPSDHTYPANPDTLERLTSEYQQGLLGADELFCRLSALLAEGVSVSMGQAGLTSTELLTLLKAESNNPETIQLSSQLLLLCDQVKFAGYQPSDQEITGALVSVRHLLTERSGGER